MRTLNGWFGNRKDHLALFTALILSLILISSNSGRQLQTIRVWTLDGFGFVFEKWSALKRLNAVYAENKWLREKNARLMLENSRFKEAIIENARLRELLEFKSNSELTLIPAKVIGEWSNGFLNSVVLAAGTSDGLQRNMPVVTAQGLVGKIFSTANGYSVSQLLLDRNFRVSAKVQRSRVTGIVKWQGGTQVILAEVPTRSDVKVGDVVITSGFSTIFPEGLEIGRVTDCSEDKKEMFMTIQLTPAVDFSRLEEVFIVKDHRYHSS